MQTLDTDAGPLTYLDEGAGPPLVLVHGIQGTARTWDKVAEALTPRYRVIRPNLRGRAGSHTPQEVQDYSLDGFARDLAAVLEWIAEPAILVAWSMGVSVTLEMLRSQAHPRPRGLLLVSGTPFVGNDARWFSDGSVAQVAEEARARGVALSLTESALPHAVAASWQHVRRADLRGSLAGIGVPVRIVHGLLDDQCPIEHGRQLMRGIRDARIDEWEGVGHNPMAADPLRFAETVDRFAADLRPTALRPTA
jgi:pimeloyl-ACP methyl ester carboxylesterase